MSEKNKDQLHVRLKPSVKNGFEGLCARQKITQVEAINQMVLWILSQSDVVQATVFDQLPPSIRVDVAKIVLEQMANPSSPEKTKGKKARYGAT